MSIHATRDLSASADRAGSEAGRTDGASSIRFGEFVAFPASRNLVFRGAPVRLGSRAFDLLMVLLQSRGAVVSKADILQYVWPTIHVDESNLRFQMATLRRALGAYRDRIKTVTGRGYLFVVDEVGGDNTGSMAPGPDAPTPVSDPVARSDRTRIFIVDQDSRNRDALQRLLTPFNVQVEAFTSLEDLVACRAA